MQLTRRLELHAYQGVTTAALNRTMVLENDVLFGTVKANNVTTNFTL